jgi:hypothetical protein
LTRLLLEDEAAGGGEGAAPKPGGNQP